MAVKIQVRRGTKANLTSYGPLAAGELGFTTDEQLVYVGDGSANYLVGRVFSSGSDPVGTGVAGTMHVNTTTSGLFFSDGTAWMPVGFSHLADLQGNLDDIADGVTYQKILATDISSGHVNQISDGTNTVTASQARTHIDDSSIHFVINDLTTVTTSVWSSQKTHDAIYSAIDGLDWQNSVLDRLSDPPGSPADGARYIVVASGTGAWSGHDDDIAEYRDSAWLFINANEGFCVAVEDENIEYVFNGTAWVSRPASTNHNSLTGLQGGTSGEYYHLTSADYSALTTNRTETIQDVVGAMASGTHTYITVNYSDATGLLDFILNDHDHSGSGSGGTIAHSALTGIGANDHHNQQHGITSADHTVTAVSGMVLATIADNTLGMTQITNSMMGAVDHSSLQNIGANDHHNQVHAFHGTDHTYGTLHAGNLLQVNVGETAPEWTDTLDGGAFA